MTGSRPAADSSTDRWSIAVPIGYRVGGWQVVRAVASGAWGSVYAAHRHGPRPDGDDGGPPDQVALKFIPSATATPRLVALLDDLVRREVIGHSTLRHDRLVRTFDVLAVEDAAHPRLDGATVLVMELATGSLADLLAGAGGRPLPDGVRYLTEVAEGLAYMHGAGWVHGDLKPSNILIRADGGCCLADFGLAGFLDGTHAYVPPLASWDYAPPERRTAVATQEGQQVRPSGDVWAFGVLAALVLTGGMPFPGETTWARAEAAAEYAAGHRGLSLGPEVPVARRSLVADCLAAAPQARPTAGDLVTRIREVVGTGPVPVASGAADGGGAGPAAGDGDVSDPPARDGDGDGAGSDRGPSVPVGSSAAPASVPSSPAGRPWSRTGRGRSRRAVIGLTAVASAGTVAWLVLGPVGEPAPSRSRPGPVASATSSAKASAPAVPAGTCVPVDREQQDPRTGVQWHRLWYCNNPRGAPQYSGPDGRTVVGWMLTTRSWFLCYRRGAPGPDGSDVWYYTQGDVAVAGWKARLAWGYTPAADVDATPRPYPGIPVCGPGT